MAQHSIRIQMPQTVWGRLLVGGLVVLVLGLAFFMLTLALAVAAVVVAGAAIRALWRGRGQDKRPPRTIEGEYSRQDTPAPTGSRLPKR